jgi:hypothetical protein
MTKDYDRGLLARSQGDMGFFEWFCDHPVIRWDAGIGACQGSCRLS